MLGEQKIVAMVECKDFRKGIIKLEWEHKMMRMQIEDLNNKMRDVQMLRLTEEQQDVSVIGSSNILILPFLRDQGIYYSQSNTGLASIWKWALRNTIDFIL